MHRAREEDTDNENINDDGDLDQNSFLKVMNAYVGKNIDQNEEVRLILDAMKQEISIIQDKASDKLTKLLMIAIQNKEIIAFKSIMNTIHMKFPISHEWRDLLLTELCKINWDDGMMFMHLGFGSGVICTNCGKSLGCHYDTEFADNEYSKLVQSLNQPLN